MEPDAGQLRLGPATPNPFGGTMRIGFHLPAAAPVEAMVLDVRGAEVARLADRSFAAGHRELHWDGRSCGGERAPAGIYFVTLRAGRHSRTRKVVLAH